MKKQEYEAMIRHDFRDHVATVSEWQDHIGSGTTLEWRKPGTSIYRIVYMMRGGLLICWGDCGEAIYAWGGPPNGRISPEWLAGLNLEYFAGKCEAWDTQRGQRGMEWDEEKAEAEIRRRIAEQLAECETDKERAKWLRIEEWAIEEAALSADAAGHFGSDHGMEELYRVGNSVSGTVRRHFYGLKMAWAQLAQREEVAQPISQE